MQGTGKHCLWRRLKNPKKTIDYPSYHQVIGGHISMVVMVTMVTVVANGNDVMGLGDDVTMTTFK